MKSSTISETDPSQIHFYGRTLAPGLRKLKPLQGGTLLEVGCGDGAILAAIAFHALGSTASWMIGIDQSLDRCRAAQKLVPTSRFIVGDGQRLPIGPSACDVIICDMLIEHVEDEEGLLSELYRVLRPGGFLHLSTVMSTGRGWYWYRRNGRCVLDPDHIREYPSAEAVANLVEAAGFQEVSATFTPVKFSLVELVTRLGLKVKLLNPTPQLRTLFVRSRWLGWLQRHFQILIPGFYTVEVAARR